MSSIQTVQNDHKLINYKTLRRIIGSIALLIAPTTALLCGNWDTLGSVSASYWTEAHDIFVGALLIVGFFLAAYKGHPSTRKWERTFGLLACVSAIGLALVPTHVQFKGQKVSFWISAIFRDNFATWHNIFGLIYFGSLICLMWIFSNHANKKKGIDKGATRRKHTYRTISILMFVGMGLLWFLIGNHPKRTFWVETWALTLFAFGWIRAGWYKSPVAQTC